MIPVIEVYPHTSEQWLRDDEIEAMEQALNILLPDLLRHPQGPEHVLSTLQTVEISIVNDNDIAAVHAEFLNDPSATDVITFPHGDGLGEIIVSAETAERYAREHGLSPKEELFRYMVHGLVHLHGYLDKTPELREDMFAVQEPLVHHFFPIVLQTQSV